MLISVSAVSCGVGATGEVFWVIMDAATLEPMTLFAMALLVIALAAGYYLVARARVHYE